MSGLFVAAIIIIPSFAPNPSISTSNWLRVCSLSSWPPPRPAPLCLPTASISSININAGEFFFACSNKSLTLDAPTPTNISTKSEPEMLKNGTPASPAIAFASKVLPVPGGPTNKTPFGILAPISVYLDGAFKKSTISSNSAFSSSAPATSSKVTLFASGDIILALLFPKFITPLLLPLPCDCCVKKKINTKNNNIIKTLGITLSHTLLLDGATYSILTSFFAYWLFSISTIESGAYTVKFLSSVVCPVTIILSGSTLILSISLFIHFCWKSLNTILSELRSPLKRNDAAKNNSIKAIIHTVALEYFFIQGPPFFLYLFFNIN